MIVIKVTTCTIVLKFLKLPKVKKEIVFKSHQQINKVYYDKFQFFYAIREKRK